MSSKYRIHPNRVFEVITPDEVAETWDFIDEELYQKLWELVGSYTEIDKEDCGPHDVIGVNAVSKFWACLSVKEQVKLNIVAFRNGNRH